MNRIMVYMRRLAGFNRNARLYLVSTVLCGLGISLLVLLYNLYILSLGFREDMIGLVNLVACLVAVVASLPMAWVVNRIGQRLALIISTLGTAVSISIPLIWPTAAALIVTELVWGVAFTLLVIVDGPFMIDNATEEERPYLFSIHFVALMVTLFIGTLIGGQLPGLIGGWFRAGPESPMAYRGALGLAVLLLGISAWPVLLMKGDKAQHAHAARPRLIVRDRLAVARLMLPSVVAALGGGMFVPFANVFWKVSHNLDDISIGRVFAISALMMTFLGMFAPVLAKRWGLVRVMVVTQIAAVAGLVAFGLSPWFSLALVGYLGRDVLMNLSRPLNGQFQMEQSSIEERAAVSAISTMLFNLAWGIGSWVSGIWQTQGSLTQVFLVSAGFYLISAALLHAFFGRRQQQENEGAVPSEVVLPAHQLAMGSPAE